MIEIIKSCLLTGALGDAYGSRFERPDLPAKEESWSFTNDLSYTMATCDSIARERSVRPKKIAKAMRDWYMNQQLAGLKGETLAALKELVAGQHWESVGKEGDLEGNSPALRVAPLAFVLDPFREEDLKILREICAITHPVEDAFPGVLAVLCSIRFIQNDRQNFIRRVIQVLPESKVKAQLIQLADSSGMRIRDVGRQFGCRNLMHESVPFAIFAAQQAPEVGLSTMMNEIVAAGGDTDANCSIAGFIAGAYLGTEAIPEAWMKKLKATEYFDGHYEVIKDFAAYVQDQSGIQTLF